MGVKHTNTDVKFSKTIRLGKNIDLDNAVAGEVEIGSLRDTGSHIERWSGTAWDIIGAAFSRKSIDFTDTPNQVLVLVYCIIHLHYSEIFQIYYLMCGIVMITYR